MVGVYIVLASLAAAQEPPQLDPAGVRGIRYLMRDDVRGAATDPDMDTVLNWYAAGLARPGRIVIPAQSPFPTLNGGAEGVQVRHARPAHSEPVGCKTSAFSGLMQQAHMYAPDSDAEAEREKLHAQR